MSIAEKLAIIAENERKVLDKVTEVADSIREYANLDNRPSLNSMANHVETVYRNGYDVGYPDGEEKGFVEGKKEGVEEGKQLEQDRFWDEYQQQGLATRYNYAFTERWTKANFKPKYNIIPTQGSYMFRSFGFDGDLAEYLDSLNVILDTSNCADLTQAFRAMRGVTRMPVIDCSSMTASLNYFISECDMLETIDKIILPPSAITFTNAFNSDKKLKEIRFEGTIYNDIAFPSSPLSRESIENIVGCLDSGASGKTVTFLKTAVLNAFGTEAAWTEYIASKENWEFTLK